jgi:hypothetical protein
MQGLVCFKDRPSSGVLCFERIYLIALQLEVNLKIYWRSQSMKKILFGLLATLIIVSATAGTVLASPILADKGEVGPYEGIFYGYVYGDEGSRAPMALGLTHRGDIVSGKVYLGEGLYVDGGVCGGVNVPKVLQSASGKSESEDPNRMHASTSFKVSNFQITANLISRLSADGESLTAEAEIDLPWLCGRDPLLTGKLSRYQ